MYPGTPAFKPGGEYRVRVEAIDRASSQPTVQEESVFWFLPPREAQVMWEAIESLEALDIPETDIALESAKVYAAHNLRAEAIDTLVALVESGMQTPKLHYRLGNLYGQSGLNLFAREHFNRAIELAQTEHSPTILTEAIAGLSIIELRLGNLESAQSYLDRARRRYEALGQGDLAQQLERIFAKLLAERTPSDSGDRVESQP